MNPIQDFDEVHVLASGSADYESTRSPHAALTDRQEASVDGQLDYLEKEQNFQTQKLVRRSAPLLPEESTNDKH